MEEQTSILIVDDEENILRSLRRLLIDEDFDVLTALSAREGLEILSGAENIALILSDQRMPEITGVDFLLRAREIVPDALRILLTGYADITATIDAINKGGVYRYISKPWNDADLLQTVRSAVSHYRLVRENRELSALVQKQNEELKEWNANLKNRVLEQTAALRARNEELRSLTGRLGKNYESCLVAFSGLIELRDREMENHSRNVAEMSVIVARKMGLGDTETEKIRVASLLHDIGKIGISDGLLSEEYDMERLSTVEEYRQHPVRGQAAIDSIEDLRPAGGLIRHHHETFDGNGFPDRLKGGDIPVGARIIAIADFFDCTVRRRCGDNRLELTLDAVRAELGTRFDPTLFPHAVDAAAEVYSKNPAVTGMVEKVVYPWDMREGMIIAREVRSGTGLLLLGRGEVLDAGKVHALRRYFDIDPPQEGVLVLAAG